MHRFRASVLLDGEPVSNIAVVRERTDGSCHYDLHKEGEGAGTRATQPPEERSQRLQPFPELEVDADSINLQIERPSVNSPQANSRPEDARRINAAARAELEKVGIAIRAEAGGTGTAAGTYQRGVIRILRAGSGKWRHTLDHEIIHAARS